jgi:catechol 2,3-dioxygenase-like lactoylglutathione lyase family enzyme
MPVQLNHTIVSSRDNKASADYLAEILGRPTPVSVFGTFQEVALDNGVSLDFMSTDGTITPQHYAFLVTEAGFDEIFARIEGRGSTYWADPGRNRPGEINHNDGGRGLYWEDPDGHLLEIITRPYGSGG